MEDKEDTGSNARPRNLGKKLYEIGQRIVKRRIVWMGRVSRGRHDRLTD